MTRAATDSGLDGVSGPESIFSSCSLSQPIAIWEPLGLVKGDSLGGIYSGGLRIVRYLVLYLVNRSIVKFLFKNLSEVSVICCCPSDLISFFTRDGNGPNGSRKSRALTPNFSFIFSPFILCLWSDVKTRLSLSFTSISTSCFLFSSCLSVHFRSITLFLISSSSSSLFFLFIE